MMVWHFVAGLALLASPAACAPQASGPDSTVSRCLDAADRRKIARAERLCKGFTFAECPWRDDIRDQHAEELAQCSGG